MAAADEVLAAYGPFVNFTVSPPGQSMPDKAYRQHSDKVLRDSVRPTQG